MFRRIQLLAAVSFSALASFGTAQTVFPEVEPNGLKSEATPVPCMVAGDSISGTTTGTATTAATTLLATADTFRVKTCALPAGIYRHTLALTTSAGTVPTATIRGLNQTLAVAGTVDSVFSSSSSGLLAWYGFGKQEQLYYRVTGSTATTGTYSATLATSSVSPGSVAGTFTPGMITISCQGQGHSTDTEIWLYDGTYTALPCGGDDDHGSLQSQITIPLPAGTYYLAVSNYNTANNLVAPTTAAGCVDQDTFQSGILLDFPDAIANNSTSTALNLQFSVSDGTNTTVQPATKALAFGIEWFRIQVGTPGPVIASYCFGDGSGSACPCGNSGIAGNGCASSVSANGGKIAGSGVASISADTFVLTGSSLPNSSALYFQGTMRLNGGAGLAFGDGLRCAGGAIIRLGTKVNAAGTSSYPSGADLPISVRGLNSAGGLRDYQCWYRNAAAYCTPSTFNLTNAVEVTWAP